MTEPKEPERVNEASEPKPPGEAFKADSKEDKGTSALVQLAEEVDVPPPVIQKMFEMGFAATGSMQQRYHPVFDKFNDEHVDKFLDYIQRDDDNDYKLRSSNRSFHLGYVALIIGFLIFLVVYLLPKDPALLNDFLKLLVVFAGGFGGGFGTKSYLDKKK